MKRAEKKRIARAIQCAVPGLYAKGSILAATPRGRILRGVCLEGSIDPDGVYLNVFVQPLYVPATTVVLSLGERLGGGCRTWSVEQADAAAVAVRDEGLPFFGPISSAEALANWAYLDEHSDARSLEVKAYSLVASGRLAEGIQALRKLAESLSGEEELEWIIEVRKQAEHLADLAETNPTAAHELLAKWESETVSALRIQDVP
jgi:hypothetical protein